VTLWERTSVWNCDV